MSSILQKPPKVQADQTYPLWLVLHGAYDVASQAIDIFGADAQARNAYLLAPQASRACGDGYCWSFAKDTATIKQLLQDVCQEEPIDRSQISLMGFSMGCTMGGWVVAQHPNLFATFSALSIGSAFEPWDLDDGGIDLDKLQHSAQHTRIFVAVDQEDPYGCYDYFSANVQQFQSLGFQVDTLEPKQGVHDITPAMKAAMFTHIKKTKHR
ncbi:MAG: alpha/beta hydrolase-fold protein [Chloroflexota bacterium]